MKLRSTHIVAIVILLLAATATATAQGDPEIEEAREQYAEYESESVDLQRRIEAIYGRIAQAEADGETPERLQEMRRAANALRQERDTVRHRMTMLRLDYSLEQLKPERGKDLFSNPSIRRDERQWRAAQVRAARRAVAELLLDDAS